MKRFFKKCHLPENLEILFMLTLGILLQMVDGSPFSLKERWMIVWETELPPENFSVFVQKFIKTVLSMIVVVRCATTYAYVVSAMLVVFCLLRNTAPKLMLLWLMIAGIKSVCMTFLEALVGVYVCSAFGNIRKACIEFFISKALEIIFAAYLWGNVMSIYHNMESKLESRRETQTKEHMYLQKMDVGRQRARSLVDESTLYRTACQNKFEFKDVPQIILQMLRTQDEMSEDSLLGPGMMLASVSNMGSLDNLKTSQSLGELGYTDLRTTQVIGLEEDENLSHRDKALKFLKLTNSEVKRIRLNKSSLENDIYTIDQEIWKRVEATGTHINKPKQARTQVFIRDIPQTDPFEENITRAKVRKKSFDYKFGFSFSNLFNEKSACIDEEQDEELIFSHEEDEGDRDQSTELFMSNIKEGVRINPNCLGIVFKKMKGNAYETLYRQDFMSVIGPEVFDKASKLLKITSLSKLSKVMEPKPETDAPASSKTEIPDLKAELSFMYKNDLQEISKSSSEGSQQPNEEDLLAFEPSGEKTESSLETDLTEEKFVDFLSHFSVDPKEEPMTVNREECEAHESVSEETSEDSLHPLNISCVDDFEECPRGPCFRKRKIIIKRVGEKKRRKWFWNSTPETKQEPNNSNQFCDVTSKSEKIENGKKESEPCSLIQLGKLNSDSETSNSEQEYTCNGQTHSGYIKQIYSINELFQKPLLDVLVTYYDLKRKIHIQRKTSALSKRFERPMSIQRLEKESLNVYFQNYYLWMFEKMLKSFNYGQHQKKVWKSNVLKMVEERNRESSATALRNILTIVKRESLLRRFIKFEYARLMYKNKNFSSSNNEIFLSGVYSNDSFSLNSSVDSIKTNVITVSNHSISKLETEIISDESRTGKIDEESTCFNREHPTEGNPEFNKLNETDGEKPSTSKAPPEAEKLTMGVIQDPEGTMDSRDLGNDPEGESICSQESDEPISLYYSKAANLASPLFDMKRFIYPDHIHYSYKHVKKRGFDVDINGGFPLLVRESFGTLVEMESKPISKKSECEITRRPMDLSFATTNAFAEWQNNDQSDLDVVISEKRVPKCNNTQSCKRERNSSIVDLNGNKKTKKAKRSKKNPDRRNGSHSSFKVELNKQEPKPYEENFNNKYWYSTKDYALIEKLLRMHMQFNSKDFEMARRKRKPVQISSAQLHSNKGRINSTYNPAICLQENKTRSEKKKIETQEERTKDMFARLEREALLQNKNVQKSFLGHC